MSEHYDMSVTWWKRSPPPVIGALVFTAAFLGIVCGFGLAYDDQEILGAIILGVTVVVCALLIVWGMKAGK